MAAADYRLLTEATGVRIAEALEDVSAMVGPPGEVSEAELTAKLADKASAIVDTASGAIASFPDGAAVPAKDITIGIEPLQAGSGDPSPTNVRPISGWTGAKVANISDSEKQPYFAGLLNGTYGFVDLGTLNWTASSEGFGYVMLSNPKRGTTNIISSSMPSAITRYQVNDNNDAFIVYFSAGTYDSATLKTAMSGVQLVYELATPQTYQLTPTEVEMLLGDNNVWADTGDSTVAYRADTKLYIQKINAPTDDDMIADAQIASGKYFIVGGNLYRSTTTIPAGDAITPGTNCILTNLADALNALNT